MRKNKKQYVSNATKTSTSMNNPIRIDWINHADSGYKGKLGMTFAPGKQGYSTYHVNTLLDRDLVLDVKDLKLAGMDILVSLLEDHEYRNLNITELAQEVEDSGMGFIGYQIRDMDVPTNVITFCQMIEKLRFDLISGKNVVVNCRGGLGRTGLLVACLLAANGYQYDDCVEITRKARPGTIQTQVQHSFLRTFVNAVQKGFMNKFINQKSKEAL